MLQQKNISLQELLWCGLLLTALVFSNVQVSTIIQNFALLNLNELFVLAICIRFIV
jgi:hypothetical protein